MGKQNNPDSISTSGGTFAGATLTYGPNWRSGRSPSDVITAPQEWAYVSGVLTGPSAGVEYAAGTFTDVSDFDWLHVSLDATTSTVGQMSVRMFYTARLYAMTPNTSNLQEGYTVIPTAYPNLGKPGTWILTITDPGLSGATAISTSFPRNVANALYDVRGLSYVFPTIEASVSDATSVTIKALYTGVRRI